MLMMEVVGRLSQNVTTQGFIIRYVRKDIVNKCSRVSTYLKTMGDVWKKLL